MIYGTANEDSVVVDMHFGGFARPFRALVRTDRDCAMQDSAPIMQEQAKKLKLWDGIEPWEKSVVVALFKDALNHIGETQRFETFEYGEALSLCIRDRTCCQK